MGEAIEQEVMAHDLSRLQGHDESINRRISQERVEVDVQVNDIAHDLFFLFQGVEVVEVRFSWVVRYS